MLILPDSFMWNLVYIWSYTYKNPSNESVSSCLNDCLEAGLRRCILLFKAHEPCSVDEQVGVAFVSLHTACDCWGPVPAKSWMWGGWGRKAEAGGVPTFPACHWGKGSYLHFIKYSQSCHTELQDLWVFTLLWGFSHQFRMSLKWRLHFTGLLH